ncbi:cation:proton antiporter [bacterium]|nr:cation:proton antiporter [bacterium]
MTLDGFVVTVILPLLGVSVVLSVVRLLIGPSLADRVVALDLLSLLGIGIVAAFALAVGQTEFFDIAIVIALVSFMTTIGFARFLEKRSEGRSADDDH